MNVVTQLTQFVAVDVINKNTTDLLRADWLYAVQLGQLSSVEFSCVVINTPLGKLFTPHCLCHQAVQLGTLGTSESWEVNRHTTRRTSAVSVVLHIYLVSG